MRELTETFKEKKHIFVNKLIIVKAYTGFKNKFSLGKLKLRYNPGEESSEKSGHVNKSSYSINKYILGAY